MNFLTIGVMIKSSLINVLIIFCFLFLCSCWNTESEMFRRTYVLNNESEIEVKLNFYSYNFEIDGYDITSYNLITNQQVERFTENSSGSFGNYSIGNSFGGDSCIIVFGQQDKYLIHVIREDQSLNPSFKNLFNQDGYILMEDKFNFFLTEEDYNNATPCVTEICGE